jgi:putative DNA primase/helicase
MTSVFKMRATSAAGGGAGRRPDAALVRAAFALLADPALSAQVQGLPSGRHRIVRGDDPEGAAAAAEWLADERGCYWSLNPCPNGRTEPLKKAAVVYRRWLLLDVDPERPKDANATEEEHERAREGAYAALDHLSGRGWPSPVVVDSGNGWHLLYRVDLPNDDDAHALLKAVIYAVADRFDTEAATFDRAVHNANRISKLPGTWACKGPSTPERPWRMAKVVYAPEVVQVVTAEQLAAVAAAPKPDATVCPPEDAAASAFRLKASGGDEARVRAYARSALEKELARVALAPTGERNTALNRAAFSLGTLVGAGLLLRQEVEQSLSAEALRAGLTEAETKATVRSGLDAGAARPRQVPPPSENGTHKAPPPPPPAEGEVVILRASAVVPRKVEWLWPGRIPLGKLTTFAGVGGLGKTFVLCDITARVTRGLDWPDSAGVRSERGSVLFISGEDDPDDTLVPRLITAGADLERVAFLTAKAEGNFTLAALQLLTTAIAQLGADTRLVVIDPPSSYLAGVDDHKNAELRGLLTPLKAWAALNRVAMVFNTHVNKATGQKVEAMMRVMGSVAWVNAVRAAHMFAKDPEDPKRRLFCGMKLNIGRERKGLAYKIAFDPAVEDGPAKIEWLGEVDTTADEAINRTSEPKRRRVAAAIWLGEVFEGRVEVPSKELFERKDKETHVSNDALREAKDDMGIKAFQADNGEGRRHWVWHWPPEERLRWRDRQRAQEEEAKADEQSF